MMRKENVDAFAARQPFQPFEVRLVDGQRFRFTSVEQIVVGRNDLAALTRNGVIVQISLGLISTIRPLALQRKRHPRKRPGNG